jgi:hypothetical protein
LYAFSLMHRVPMPRGPVWEQARIELSGASLRLRAALLHAQVALALSSPLKHIRRNAPACPGCARAVIPAETHTQKRACMPRLRSQKAQSAAPPAMVPSRYGLISMIFLTEPEAACEERRGKHVWLQCRHDMMRRPTSGRDGTARTDVRPLRGPRVHRDEHAALELEGERRGALHVGNGIVKGRRVDGRACSASRLAKAGAQAAAMPQPAAQDTRTRTPPKGTFANLMPCSPSRSPLYTSKRREVYAAGCTRGV